MSIQTEIDGLAGKGVSITNLGLNALGVAKMAMGKKDVYITLANKKSPYEVLVADQTKKLNFAGDYAGLNPVIMYADVIDTSELCEHPLESGAKIVDHQIQNPVEIKLQLVLPYYLYEGIYKELNDFKQNGTLLDVHTKAGTYNNMVLKDIPHKESVENIDRLVFDCTLRQAFLITGQKGALVAGDVKVMQDASTKKVGQKKAKKSETSLLVDIRESVRKAVGLK